MHQGRFAVLSAALLMGSLQAYADDRGQAMPRPFDKPVATRTVLAKSDAEEGNELRCTYYPDFMIREKGTDTPAPDAAVIIAVTKAAPLPPCKTASGTTTPLGTANFSLAGRKGPFLVFEATDPNGAVPFLVIDAATGKTIYTDGMIQDRMQSVTLKDGVLHMKYTRGANGSCSLIAGGSACWTKMVTEGTVPAEMAQSPLAAQACTASYHHEKAPPDDPSIVSFDVDMTLDSTGAATIISRGKPGCSPMP